MSKWRERQLKDLSPRARVLVYVAVFLGGAAIIVLGNILGPALGISRPAGVLVATGVATVMLLCVAAVRRLS
jgi:hypothetical protein